MLRVLKAGARGACLASLVMLFSWQVVAEESSEQPDRDESCREVDEWLDAGDSPGGVITAMMNAGMNRAEGTVFAMLCAEGAHREAIALAGVQEAANLREARSVAAAVLAMTGDTGPVADTVRRELASQEKLARQPSIYEGDYDPGGGGVSPST